MMIRKTTTTCDVKTVTLMSFEPHVVVVVVVGYIYSRQQIADRYRDRHRQTQTDTKTDTNTKSKIGEEKREMCTTKRQGLITCRKQHVTHQQL